jgi:hypothetical protein
MPLDYNAPDGRPARRRRRRRPRRRNPAVGRYLACAARTWLRRRIVRPSCGCYTGARVEAVVEAVGAANIATGWWTTPANRRCGAVAAGAFGQKSGWLRLTGTPSPEKGPSPPPAHVSKTVDFVCEADVRLAIKENRKIFINRKTVVTPSARDLADPSDILVLAQG